MDFYRRDPFVHSAIMETSALIDDIPDLVALQSNAETVVTNLFGIGFMAIAAVMYPNLVQDITALTIGLASLGWCAYFALTGFRAMNEQLRDNRLQLVPSFLFGTLALALLCGAVAVKPVVLLRDWFAPSYGMVAFLAALLVAAVLSYLIIGKGLARLMISPHAMREV
jgi:hypothetical protein